MRRHRVAALERQAWARVFEEEVLRRRPGRVDDAMPRAARRRWRDAEVERLAPGIAGDVEVAVEFLVTRQMAVETVRQDPAPRREVGIVRLDAVPDDVRRPPAVRAGTA